MSSVWKKGVSGYPSLVDPLPPLSPAAFLTAARELAAWGDEHGDPEVTHGESDEIMESLLKQLGYGEGVAVLSEMTRWYA